MTSSRIAFPAFLIGSATLSAGPLLVRLTDVGAVQSAFWRLALAVLPLLALVRLDRQATPRSAMTDRRLLIAAGACFAADLAVWHLGIRRTTLANATLFANAASFLYPLYGYIALRAWPDRRAGVALLLAAAGILLLMGLSADISTRHLAGDLLCLLAAVFYTGYLVTMERARGGLSALAALGWATAVGAVVLLPVALLSDGGFWPHDWTPLVFLALGSQVLGQGLIIFALPHLSPLASGLGLLIQPLFAAAMGRIWFNEQLGPAQSLGMLAIFAALLLVRQRQTPRPQPREGGAQRQLGG